jgi:hypothetical protein
MALHNELIIETFFGTVNKIKQKFVCKDTVPNVFAMKLIEEPAGSEFNGWPFNVCSKIEE